MTFMSFMEAMGTSGIPAVAAFFIGLMAAISPCPLATNIAAIAHASKKMKGGRHTLLVGIFYTLGRMATYVAIASAIVWFGMNTQPVALFLQKYGEMLLGPFLVLCGILMLDVIRFGSLGSGEKLGRLKEKLAGSGLLGSFLLGAVFALAFCPFSAVLFFGMLIPLAVKAGDGLVLPTIFAFATGLPVILFSLLLVHGVSRLGKIMGKIQAFEKWTRTAVAVVFIIVGLYYTGRFLL